MAKVKGRRRPTWLDVLFQTLRAQLRAVGIGEVDLLDEPINGTKLHRVTVVAPKFAALRPSERQDLVWRIAEQVLNKDQQLQLSMILTLTPKEISAD